jgi:hypothetical protein
MSPQDLQPYQHEERDRDRHYPRPAHHHYRSPVGHWTRTLGALAPLVITELVPEPRKQIRFIRIASVALAAISEMTYAYQLNKERAEREEEREHRR